MSSEAKQDFIDAIQLISVAEMKQKMGSLEAVLKDTLVERE